MAKPKSRKKTKPELPRKPGRITPPALRPQPIYEGIVLPVADCCCGHELAEAVYVLVAGQWRFVVWAAQRRPDGKTDWPTISGPARYTMCCGLRLDEHTPTREYRIGEFEPLDRLLTTLLRRAESETRERRKEKTE